MDNSEIYKGYKKISGDTAYINQYMEDIQIDEYSDWNTNEYLILHNTDDNSESEMRFDGERFVALKLPPSRYIKGRNALQRCALDMLNNKDITIVALLGTFGSGKTHLAFRMSTYSVMEKGWQSKILGVRSPIGEGREVGFLPGTLDDKVSAFFLPLEQQLEGGVFELERMNQMGVLDTNIPVYMKGTTYADHIVIVDEAEDLTLKEIRLIGTRLGQNSRIFFSGDYLQSVLDASNNNPLLVMCNKFKGDSKFGCIMLDEDVRSATSKMFASLLD